MWGRAELYSGDNQNKGTAEPDSSDSIHNYSQDRSVRLDAGKTSCRQYTVHQPQPKARSALPVSSSNEADGNLPSPPTKMVKPATNGMRTSRILVAQIPKTKPARVAKPWKGI